MLYFLMVVIVAYAAPVEGRPHIVNGQEAEMHSIPWIVHYGCGGSLIRVSDKNESDIVLSAAHCTKNSTVMRNVVLGRHYLNSTVPGERKVRTALIVNHPDYKYLVPYQNDICIIKLEKPVQFSDTIQPIDLPKQGEIIPAGTFGVVAGWGRLVPGPNEPNSNELREVAVPVSDTYQCHLTYQPYMGIDENGAEIDLQVDAATMLCAGYETGGKDSCQGDSGGPLFFKQEGKFVLQGIVSWGAFCALPHYPGVYTRVSAYIDWIQDQVREISSVH